MKSFKYILLLISLFSYLLPANAIWLSVDPLSDKYPHISPYAYCGNNPVKFVDPNGMWVESAWDAASVAMGISSLSTNVREHNIKDAIVDGVGIVLDLAAVALPIVPGGYSYGKCPKGA